MATIHDPAYACTVTPMVRETAHPASMITIHARGWPAQYT